MRSWSWRAIGVCMVTCALWAGGCETGPVITADAGAEAWPGDAGAAMDPVACEPSCDEPRCGMPDGCGGTCAPCPVPSCDCGERVCGDDGCGGSCGGCSGAETCAPDGARCDCGDATVTYRVSAPEVDWQRTGRVIVAVRQRFAMESGPTTETVVLDGIHPDAEITFEGACEPDLEVRWEYVSRWRDMLGRALRCDGDEWHLEGETSIVLPPGTGGACRPG